MLEAAQGEIKVLESKWKGRMDLPMTEVRAEPAADFSLSIARASPVFPSPAFPRRTTPEIDRRVASEPTSLPLSLPTRFARADWRRRALHRGGVRVVLRRRGPRPRRLHHRILSGLRRRGTARGGGEKSVTNAR